MQQCCLPAGEQLSDAFLRPPCLLRGTASVGNIIATLCCDAGCDCSTFRAEPLAHTICEPHHPLRVSARGTKSTATILDALRPKSQENNGRNMFCILYQSKIIVSVISTFILEYRQRLFFHTNVLNLLCNSLNRSIISSKEGALA